MQLAPWRIPTVSKTVTIASTMEKREISSLECRAEVSSSLYPPIAMKIPAPIISARKATKHEKDRSYAGDREIW